MAETTVPGPSKRGTIITLTDGTGSPLTFVVNHGEAQPSFTDPVHDEVWAKDANGDYLPTCRRGDQTAPAKVDLSGCRVFHAGDMPTETSLVDIALNKGIFASTWTSTETGSEFKSFTVTIRAPQNTAGTTYSTYTWTDMHVQPGATVEIRPGGYFITSFVLVGSSACTVVDTP